MLLFVCALQLLISANAHSDHQGAHATLSENKHFQNEQHNLDYDHEAFLGRGHGHDFDKLSDEESKKRLRKIVVKIDKNKDLFVTQDELFQWIELQRTRYMWDMIDDHIRYDDKDKDGKLTWKEYKASHYGEWDHEASMDEVG